MAEPNQALTQSKHGYVYGDVDIAPGVAMAEGVLLGAEPGCRLVISAGVCLGADVVIRVSRGTLVIEPGANLGSGVLVVGPGRIGHHACIGANSTVINPNVEAHAVVAPKMLLGDPSQLQASSAPAQNSSSPESGFSSNGGTASGNAEFVPVAEAEDILSNGDIPSVEAIPSSGDTFSNGVSGSSQNGRQPAAEDSPNTEPQTATEGQSVSKVSPEGEGNSTNGSTPSSPGESSENQESSETKSLTNVTHVYGKKQVSQLLETLFPHRRPLNGSTSEDKT
jgi:carbon dioxide concentrating mechanism protein CcmN